MLEGRRKEDWQHTGQLSFILANVFRDSRTPQTPYHCFNPYADKPVEEEQNQEPEDIDSARAVWLNLVGTR